jgi:hypothetical protein
MGLTEELPMIAARTTFVFLLALVLGSVSVSGAELAPGVPTSGLEIDRPTLPWTLPTHEPPIRALVIAPWIASRDVTMLAQHMALRVDLVETRDSSRIDFDDDTLSRTDHPEFAHTTQRLQQLLEKRYDVIVLATFNFSALPAKLQYLLLSRVVEGTGLVLANQGWHPHDELQEALLKFPVRDQPWRAAAPWEAFQWQRIDAVRKYPGVGFHETKTTNLRQFADERAFLKKVRRFDLKKGRLALLDYAPQGAAGSGTSLSPASAYPLDRLIQQDYYIAIAARQVRWAARREPPLGIADVQPNARSIDRGELAAAGRVVLAGDRPLAAGHRLRLVVRDLDGRVHWRQEQDLPGQAGPAEIAVSLPALAAGEYFFDAWLLGQAGVIDWGSAHFTVTSPLAIETVRLDRDVLRPGEPIAGSVRLTGPAPQGTCRLRIVDSYGRLELEEPVPLAAGQAECRFRVALPHPVGIVFRVEAILEAGGQALATAKAEFTIPKSLTEDRFYGILWGGSQGPGRIGDLVFREARRYGYDASLAGYPTEYYARAAATADLALVPYMTRLLACDGKDFCYNTPQWRSEMAAGLSAHAAMIARYGALGYSLGDEVEERPLVICESPTCQAALREYLKKLYGTISALNAKWHSNFSDWDQVRPGWVAEARKKKNFVPWIDYQTHRRDLWLESCRWCADAIHRGDPGARMGYEGSPGYERWPELLEFFRITGPYDSPDNDIVVDLRRPGSIVGNWIGNYTDPESLNIRYMSWRRLLLGFNSQWWWTQNLSFNGDGTPTRRFAENVQALAEIRGGLGRLLAGGTFVHDAIAIPYCPASEFASEAYSQQTSIQGAKDALRAMLWDLGLHYWRIPLRQIAAGELQKRGIRVLFLPYHQAMSRVEAAGIRQFVADGGTLIADLRPAVMDEHGAVLDEGYLDATFGVHRAKAGQSEGVVGVPQGPGLVGGIQQSGLSLTADRLVSARDGKASGTVGETPICITHAVGKGRAVLLNFVLDGYLAAREAQRHEGLRSLLAGLLEQAGVKGGVQVVADGRLLVGARLSRWSVGPTLVIGIDRDPVAPARDARLSAEVRWPRPGEVYDVRAGKYLGRQQSTPIELAVHEPRMLALVPYRIGPLSLTGTEKARPGAVVTLGVTLAGAAGAHVVCLDVFGPDGRRRVFFRRELLLSAGNAEAIFPLALNDLPGAWRIRAQETISGQTAWHEVQVATP